MYTVRMILRWAISFLLVTLVASYLFWQWRFGEYQVLKELSYDAFHDNFAEDTPAAYWTYALYVILAVACINATAALLAWGLGRVFPDSAVKLPKTDS